VAAKVSSGKAFISASEETPADYKIVVIFGDPLNGTAVAQINPSKVLIICHPQDYICKGTIVVDSEHLDVSRFLVLPVSSG
jgi:hypothetical protein